MTQTSLKNRTKSKSPTQLLRWMSCFLILLGLLSTRASAQQIVIGATTGTTNSYFYGPIYRSSATSTFNFSNYAHLYTAAELGGMASGSIINNVEWLKYTAATLTGSNNTFEVWLSNTASTTLTTGTTWGTLKAGATLVYSSATVNITGAAATYWGVPTSSFVYTGGNLLVLCRHVKAGTASAVMPFYTNVATNLAIGAASGTATTDATALSTTTYGNNRPTIRISYVAGSPCSGTPAPGNTVITAGSNPTCSGSNFTLGLQNLTSGSGVTYQWQSADDAGFTVNVANLGTGSTQTTSQTAAKFYKCFVTCAGNTTPSNALEVTMQTGIGCLNYCVGANNCSIDYISNVTFGTINRTSICDAYTTYTTPNPNITQGTNVPISVSTGGDTEGAKVWIDWNQDGVFANSAPELVFAPTYAGTNPAVYAGTVAVPAGAAIGTTKMRVRCNYAAVPVDPCTAQTYGETEDYYVTVLASAPCAGTPAPGNTVSTSNPACSGASFTLSLQNVTSGSGVTYQWQSADDNGFTVNVVDLGTASSQVTSQTAAKYYRCLVTCSGNTGISNPLQITMQTNPAACYCGGVLGTYTNIGCNFGLGIEDVIVAGINNVANGCGGPLPTVYTDYTYISGNVEPGLSYPITIGRGAFVNNACAFGVWVDWNNNNSFDDAGEYMSISLTGGAGVGQASNTGTLVVPPGATLGSKVMRIRSNFSVPPSSTTACASLYTYGETEDYILNVVGACAGAPVPGTTLSFSSLACPNVPFTLYLSGVGAALGLTYQWQTSPDNIAAYTNIAGATNPTRSQTQSTSAYYRCMITCSNSGLSASSTPLQMNMDTYANCICTSPTYSGNGTGGCTGTTANNYIGNVSFAGINNTTGCGANAAPYYQFFPGQIALVNQTVTYPITISAPPAGAAFQRFKVFIDFNDNASCDDPGEMVYNSGPISTSVNSTTGFISIAANAPLGTHKLRVRSSNPLSTNQDANSCSDDGYYGEVEEYEITISGPPACTGTPTPGQTLASTPLACSSTSISLGLQNATSGAGVTYQWQSSLDAAFTTPVNLGTAATETATQTATTWYRCIVTCSGNDGISTPVQVSYSIPCYCTSPVHGSDGCPLGLYIDNFTFANINNTSGCYSNVPYTTPFYSYFPGSVANVELGVSYTYSITTPINAGAYTQWFGIYIDFNDNGSFDDAGELIASTNPTISTAVNTFSGSYIIPLSSPTGVHKMRIRSGNAAPINSCSAASSGETEDYLINIACGATASSNSPVCPGETLNLSSTFNGSGTPVSYSWTTTSANGFTAGTQNASISNVTSANDAGDYTVTITDNTGCVATNTITVIVSEAPVPTANSNSPVCEGQSISLFGDNVASGQSSGNGFSWSGPSGFNDIVQNPTISGAQPSASGTYTVTVTNQFGCSASTTTSVVVSPNPALNILSQTNVDCNGASTGEFTIEVTNASGSYLYDENGNINFDGMFSAYSAGTYNVQVTDINSCASTISVTITEPDPTTTADAGSDQSLCAGATATMSANTALVGTGSWSLISGAGTFTDATDPATTVTGIGNGVNTYRWTITNTLCSNSNFDDVDVTGGVLPTGTITGTQEICIGGSASLTITFTGNGPWIYAINGGTPVSTSTNPETVSVTPATTTVYTITSLSDANCTGSGVGSATVTVTAAPPASSCTITSLPVDACVGSTVVVSTNVVPGATSYTWSAPAGTLINGLPSPQTVASNSVNITLGTLPANASSWLICAFASNACGSTNTNCKYIRGSLSTPSPISGSTVACPSTGPSNYTTTAVGGASSYSWSITGDASVTGTGTTGAVTFGPTFTTGSLCVRALLPCGYQGPQRCLTIANGTPVLGVMSGTFSVCPGTSGVAYSVPPSAGATTYNWTVPAGASVATGAGTNSITVDFGPTYTNGNVCVIATSICGINSLPRCKTVASNKPGTPGNFTSGATTGVCGQTVTYSVNSVAGATGYTWTAPAGASLASANGTNTIDIAFSPGYTTGNVCVTADNACGSGTPRCVLVKGSPSNPGAITGSNSVCANDAGVGYSISPVFGATGYVWTVPSGAIIVSGQGTTAIIVDWGTSGGVIGVTANGTCGTSGTRTLVVSMNCKISSSTLPGASVNAYPNPVSTQLNVELNAISGGTYTVELMDLAGRVIYSNVITANEGINNTVIDVATYAKGVYTMRVKNSDGFAQQIRVVVE